MNDSPNAPPPHPNAFKVQLNPHGFWEVTDGKGNPSEVFHTEDQAKVAASVLKQRYDQSVRNGSPSPTSPLPSFLISAMNAARAAAPPPVQPPVRPSAVQPQAPSAAQLSAPPWMPPSPAPPPPIHPGHPAYVGPSLNIFPPTMRPTWLADEPVPQGPPDDRPSPPDWAKHIPPHGRPDFGQNLVKHFHGAIARQSHYGYVNMGHAARAAFTAAAPEAAIGLAVAGEAKRVISDSIKGLHDFAERMNEANRSLAPFSAKLQQSYAQLSLNDMRRTMNMAKNLEDPASALVKFTDEMRQTLQPLILATQQASLEGASFGAGTISGLGGELKPIADLIIGLKNLTDPEGGLANTIGSSIAQGIASFTPFFGQMIGAIELINKTLGFGEGGEVVGAGGPWEAMILHEAGPMRSDPIRPARKIDLGRRKP